MARRDNALAITGPLIKSILFAMVGLFVLAVLWIQFGQIRFTGQKQYSAIFSTASGLRASAPVTANGVTVGRVDQLTLLDNQLAKVDFSLDASVPLTKSTRATIRYKNLTGDQYLDLSPGAPGAAAMANGDTIPISQTKPSLDIDALLNGFNPLLQGLQPAQVNQLSAELVTVLQGQGGRINSVLAHAASFSGTLADQDAVIGRVITSLNSVLGNLDQHAGQLSDTVRTAQQLITQLNSNRHELVEGLEKTGHLANRVGDIASALRSGHDTFRELGRASDVFVSNGQEVDRILRLMPAAYMRLGRLSVAGSAYQLRICSADLRMTGPDGMPFYTPKVGPSDNNVACSRDNVAPLQGSAPTNIYGPPLPVDPYDGQAVAAQAKDQDKGAGYVPPHKANNGSGR
ncbi:MAG TPA: MlaD family protein [Pseudonocardia sp.]|jgi:phospholipid/cholesterol/gamma-HCH transport system substrate-binding protein